MKTQQTRLVIGHALRDLMVPSATVSDAEVAQFASLLTEMVNRTIRLAVTRDGCCPRGSEYRKYMDEEVEESRQDVFRTLSGNAAMVAALGHTTRGMERVIDNLIRGN